MTDWVVVNGARIERSYFEANLEEARSVKWSESAGEESKVHIHCMVCGVAIGASETRMISSAGYLCLSCYDQFLRE